MIKSHALKVLAKLDLADRLARYPNVPGRLLQLVLGKPWSDTTFRFRFDFKFDEALTMW